MGYRSAKILSRVGKLTLLLCVFIMLGLGIYYTYLSIRFRPYKVRVSNVTDSAFTVSWVTDEPMVGVVYYGDKDSFLPGPLSWLGKKRAFDDRDVSDAQTECVSKFNKKVSKNRDENFTVDASGFDCNEVKVIKKGQYYTHHVTVPNLDADKEYYFRVGNGYISFKEGKTKGVEYIEREMPAVGEFKQKTRTTIKDISSPKPAYGTSYNVFYSSDGQVGTKKSFDSVIFLKTFKNGEEYPLMSAVTNSNGGWSIDLSNVRDKDNNILAMEDTYLEFIPQVDNARPGASGTTKFEKLSFPLDLMGNNIDDLNKEVKREEGELGALLKDLVSRVGAYDMYDETVQCWSIQGCEYRVFQQAQCPVGYTSDKTKCNKVELPSKENNPLCCTSLCVCTKDYVSCPGTYTEYPSKTACQKDKETKTKVSCCTQLGESDCLCITNRDEGSCGGDYPNQYNTNDKADAIAQCKANLPPPPKDNCYTYNPADNSCTGPKPCTSGTVTWKECQDKRKSVGTKSCCKVVSKSSSGVSCTCEDKSSCAPGEIEGSKARCEGCFKVVKGECKNGCQGYSVVNSCLGSGGGVGGPVNMWTRLFSPFEDLLVNKSYAQTIPTIDDFMTDDFGSHNVCSEGEGSCESDGDDTTYQTCIYTLNKVESESENNVLSFYLEDEGPFGSLGTTLACDEKDYSLGMGCMEVIIITDDVTSCPKTMIKRVAISTTEEYGPSCEQGQESGIYGGLDYCLTNGKCYEKCKGGTVNYGVVDFNKCTIPEGCNKEWEELCANGSSSGICEKLGTCIDTEEYYYEPTTLACFQKRVFESSPDKECTPKQVAVSVCLEKQVSYPVSNIAITRTEEFSLAMPCNLYSCREKVVIERDGKKVVKLESSNYVNCIPIYREEVEAGRCNPATDPSMFYVPRVVNGTADCYPTENIAAIPSSHLIFRCLREYMTLNGVKCGWSEDHAFSCILVNTGGTFNRVYWSTEDCEVICTDGSNPGLSCADGNMPKCKDGGFIYPSFDNMSFENEDHCHENSLFRSLYYYNDSGFLDSRAVCLSGSNLNWADGPCTSPIILYGAEHWCKPPSLQDIELDSNLGTYLPSKLINQIYAQEEILAMEEYIYYFPEEGVHTVKLIGGQTADLIASGSVGHRFYQNRNGIPGYQEPQDMTNPKSDEDLLIPPSVAVISTTKTGELKKIELKKGVNIVSFNFVPNKGGKGASLSSAEFLEIANMEGNNVSAISYFGAGQWGSGNTYDFVDKKVRGTPFDLVFGKGYALIAERDVTISVPGDTIASPVPIAFSSGWNLIGVHGHDTQYTAKSLINSVNSIEGLKANNVTYWPTSKGMYQGFQLSEGQEYGQDFPISKDLGYFVRINEIKEDCRSIWWNPDGEGNGKCNSQ